MLEELSIKQCIIKYNFSKNVFDFLILTIKDKILSAFIEPGEMVGCISAQSIVEPLTQMTLNTFHLAGVAAGSVSTTTGVPRFNEIINYSSKQTLKTPSMTIYPKDDSIDIMDLKDKLEFILLKDFVKKTQIIFDKNDSHISCNEEELEYIHLYKEFSLLLGDEDCNDMSSWLLKIEFDIDSMIYKKISIGEIHDIVSSNFVSNNSVECLNK